MHAAGSSCGGRPLWSDGKRKDRWQRSSSTGAPPFLLRRQENRLADVPSNSVELGTPGDISGFPFRLTFCRPRHVNGALGGRLLATVSDGLRVAFIDSWPSVDLTALIPLTSRSILTVRVFADITSAGTASASAGMKNCRPQTCSMSGLGPCLGVCHFPMSGVPGEDGNSSSNLWLLLDNPCGPNALDLDHSADMRDSLRSMVLAHFEEGYEKALKFPWLPKICVIVHPLNPYCFAQTACAGPCDLSSPVSRILQRLPGKSSVATPSTQSCSRLSSLADDSPCSRSLSPRSPHPPPPRQPLTWGGTSKATHNGDTHCMASSPHSSSRPCTADFTAADSSWWQAFQALEPTGISAHRPVVATPVGCRTREDCQGFTLLSNGGQRCSALNPSIRSEEESNLLIKKSDMFMGSRRAQQSLQCVGSVWAKCEALDLFRVHFVAWRRLMRKQRRVREHERLHVRVAGIKDSSCCTLANHLGGPSIAAKSCGLQGHGFFERLMERLGRSRCQRCLARILVFWRCHCRAPGGGAVMWAQPLPRSVGREPLHLSGIATWSLLRAVWRAWSCLVCSRLGASIRLPAVCVQSKAVSSIRSTISDEIDVILAWVERRHLNALLREVLRLFRRGLRNSRLRSALYKKFLLSQRRVGMVYLLTPCITFWRCQCFQAAFFPREHMGDKCHRMFAQVSSLISTQRGFQVSRSCIISWQFAVSLSRVSGAIAQICLERESLSHEASHVQTHFSAEMAEVEHRRAVWRREQEHFATRRNCILENLEGAISTNRESRAQNETFEVQMLSEISTSECIREEVSRLNTQCTCMSEQLLQNQEVVARLEVSESHQICTHQMIIADLQEVQLLHEAEMGVNNDSCRHERCEAKAEVARHRAEIGTLSNKHSEDQLAWSEDVRQADHKCAKLKRELHRLHDKFEQTSCRLGPLEERSWQLIARCAQTAAHIEHSEASNDFLRRESTRRRAVQHAATERFDEMAEQLDDAYSVRLHRAFLETSSAPSVDSRALSANQAAARAEVAKAAATLVDLLKCPGRTTAAIGAEARPSSAFAWPQPGILCSSSSAASSSTLAFVTSGCSSVFDTASGDASLSQCSAFEDVSGIAHEFLSLSVCSVSSLVDEDRSRHVATSVVSSPVSMVLVPCGDDQVLQQDEYVLGTSSVNRRGTSYALAGPVFQQCSSLQIVDKGKAMESPPGKRQLLRFV